MGACCLSDGSCFDGTESECVAQGGQYQGDGSNCASVDCPQPPGEKCLGDFDGDGQVGVADLLFLLASWGPCTECADPFACGDSPVPFCDPASDCVCWTAPDGSGVCGINTTCSTQPLCPAGDDCPPGFVCSVADCCGVNTCWAACDAPGAMQPELQFGDLTGLGIAGVDFEIGNPTQANDNPDCPGDLNFDNEVGVSDLLALLAAWGPCPGVCGGADTGSCFVANGSPFCDDADCCNTVCAVDPFCCDTEWDGICADEAITMCLGLEPCVGVAPGCPAEVCGENSQGPLANCFCFEVAGLGDTYCIDDFFCSNPGCDADLNCPPGMVCITNSCCGEPICAPGSNTCGGGVACDSPFVCGNPVVECEPGCVCFTRFGGGGVCAISSGTCVGNVECPDGTGCPPGFQCIIDTCCTGINICLAECGTALAEPIEYTFGELTPIGVAGVDFEIPSNGAQAPQPRQTGLTGAGNWID